MLPLKTVSEGNCFEHWHKKHKRHKNHQNNIIYALEPHLSKITLPCVITLTRYAPREIDSWDNLPYSFKWQYDAVCGAILPGLKPGRADNDKRLQVRYNQIKSKEYGVKIEIDSRQSTTCDKN